MVDHVGYATEHFFETGIREHCSSRFYAVGTWRSSAGPWGFDAGKKATAGAAEFAGVFAFLIAVFSIYPSLLPFSQ